MSWPKLLGTLGRLVVAVSVLSMISLARAQDPIGHWTLDDGGGATAADAAGTSAGTLVNMDEGAWVAARVGAGAMRFDGEDDHVEIPDPGLVSTVDSFTWTAWIKVDEPGANGGIISKSPVDEWTFGSKGLFVGPDGERDSGQLAFDVGWIGALVSERSVDDGRWHHVAVSVAFNTGLGGTGDFTQLFIDGEPDAFRDDWDLDTPIAPQELVDEGEDTTPEAEGPVKIGLASETFPCEEVGPCSFLGTIDDVRIYDSALSDDAIRQLVVDATDCDGPDTHCTGVTVRGPGDSNQSGIWTVTVEGSDDDNDGDLVYTISAEREADPPIVRTQVGDGVFEIRLRSGTWTIGATVDDEPLCAEPADDSICETDPFEVVRAPELTIGHWCFNEASGETAADRVDGNDGTLTNMDHSAWVVGPAGEADSALHFDGEDDVVVIADPDHFALHEGFTWSASIKTTSDGTILAKSNPDDEWSYGAHALFVREGLLVFDVGWVGDMESVRDVNDGSWHHVAITADYNVDGFSEDVNLYVDGELDSSLLWDIEEQGSPEGPLHVGRGSLDFPEETQFQGAIDNVQVWNYALSADEILEVFEEPDFGCDPAQIDCPSANDPDFADTHCRGIEAVGPDDTELAGVWTLTVDATDDSGTPPEELIYELTAQKETDPPSAPIVRRQVAESVFEIRLTPGLWSFSAAMDDDSLCEDRADDAVCTLAGVEVLRPEGGDAGGHWCLEDEEGEIAGERLASNDGTLMNYEDPDDAWVAGEVTDIALSFDGIDDHVIVENSEAFDIHFADHSWSLWFRTEMDGGLMAKGPTDTDWDDPDHRGGRALFINGGSLTVDVGWVGAIGGATFVSDDAWHHAVMTVEMDTVGTNDTIRIYVDGVLDAVSEELDIGTQIPNAVGDLKFGWTGEFEDAPMQYLTGELDDVRFFDVALDEDEVLDLFDDPGGDCDEPPPDPRPTFVRGDSNSSGVVDLTDGVNTLNFLFLGGPPPACVDSADADDSGALAITDAVLTFGYLFLGDRPPAPPTPGATVYSSEDCGVDPQVETPDLGCAMEAEVCG